MKIIAPASSAQEIPRLVQAGADEIYCGVLTKDWIQKYTGAISNNIRSLAGRSNMRSFAELRDVTRKAHALGIPVFLTLNSRSFTEEQYGAIEEHIRRSIDAGIDALVVSDVGLLLFLKKSKIEVDLHLSSCAAAFNTFSVAFYKDLGVSRVILPTGLQPNECAAIITNNPGMLFEVFVLNNCCNNINGFCTFQHSMKTLIAPLQRLMYHYERLFRPRRKIPRRPPQKKLCGRQTKTVSKDFPCALDYDVTISSAGENIDKEHILDFFSSSFHPYHALEDCDACNISEFIKMGVYGIKIAGREYPVERKIADVQFIKKALVSTKEPERRKI